MNSGSALLPAGTCHFNWFLVGYRNLLRLSREHSSPMGKELQLLVGSGGKTLSGPLWGRVSPHASWSCGQSGGDQKNAIASTVWSDLMSLLLSGMTSVPISIGGFCPLGWVQAWLNPWCLFFKACVWLGAICCLQLSCPWTWCRYCRHTFEILVNVFVVFV